MNILIAGATGYIGRNLCNKLFNEKHNLTIITRDKIKAKLKYKENVNIIDWDYLNTKHETANFDLIINLTGETIGDHRWDKKTKEKILSSRVNSTRTIVNFIKNLNPECRPKTLINASAIGIYGTDENKLNSDINNTIPDSLLPASDFLESVCHQWEAQAYKAEQSGVRVVTVRTGLVLGSEGALKKMLLPFRLFIGGPLGSGKQYLSWIHINDLVEIYFYIILNPNLKGPINAVSPIPITMYDFSKTLAKVLNRPCFFRVPSFILRFIFGEMANLLIKGQKVIPDKLFKEGFTFRYSKLEYTFNDLLD